MFSEFANIPGDVEAFLCHSSADKGFVRMVHDDLKRVGVKCWLDENEIRAGQSIVDQISIGLTTSKYVLVFLSEASIGSKWASKEWQAALSRFLSGEDVVVVPILVEACSVPSILRDIKYANFSESYHDGFKELYIALR